MNSFGKKLEFNHFVNFFYIIYIFLALVSATLCFDERQRDFCLVFYHRPSEIRSRNLHDVPL